MNAIGGQLDVIIDDRAHTNTAIMTSFNACGHAWPTEGCTSLRISTSGVWRSGIQQMASTSYPHFTSLQEQLVVFRGWGGAITRGPSGQLEIKRKHPLPCGVKFIYCQDAACVIGRRPSAIAIVMLIAQVSSVRTSQIRIEDTAPCSRRQTAEHRSRYRFRQSKGEAHRISGRSG